MRGQWAIVLAAVVGLLGVTQAGVAKPAGGAGKVATEIRKQYWQVLPGIRDVWLTSGGEPWLSTSAACSVEKSYAGKLKLMPYADWLILGDRGGRLWISDRFKNTPTRMYDGKAWAKLAFRARAAFEGPGGCVLLAGPKQLHACADGRWATIEHSNTGVNAEWRFAADPAGNVWAWAYGGIPAVRPGGAFRYGGGKWAHYTAAGGLPFDRIEAVVPLAAGRYLLITDEQGVSPNFAVWGCAEAGGKPVPKTDTLDFLPGVSAKHLRYRGVDSDGTHYVGATGLIRNHQDVAGVDTAVVCFTAAGAGTIVAPDESEFFRDMPRHGDRLHFSLTDPNAWDGERAHHPPVAGVVYGRDRLGRIYFRPGTDQDVQVIWPAYERPGDVIRPVRAQGLGRYSGRYGRGAVAGLGRAFQDTGGGIWLLAATRLLRWDGSDWRPTPVEEKPHPQWRAEPAPPWTAFARGMHVVEGAGGALLGVAVRDVYQDAAAAEGPARPGRRGGVGAGWRGVRGLGQAAQQAGKPVYWLEGWLCDGGTWAGPMKIDELIAKHLATLRKRFTVQTPASAYFDVQSDGRRVWVAYESTVRVHCPDGKVLTWGIPRPPSRQRLMEVNLIRRPGGRMWCVYFTGKGLEAACLRVAEGAVQAESLAKAAVAGTSYIRWVGFLTTGDGQLWRSDVRRRPSWRGLPVWPLLWKDDAWADPAEPGALLLETSDGEQWFVPKANRGASAGGAYNIRGAGGVSRLDWPACVPMGAVTEAGPALRLAACGRYVVSIVKAGKGAPCPWKVGRVHLLIDLTEQAGVFLDGKGHIVGAGGWAAAFPVKAGRAGRGE